MLKFSMQHRARLTRLVTPQAERNPGTRLLVRTNAPVWPATEWERFDRFLIFGSERGAYFMRERQLTVENATDVLACIAADGPRAVRRIVELSALGRVMSNDTCVFALALAATFGNAATRTMALEAVPEVARTSPQARRFGQYLQALESTQGMPNASGTRHGSGGEAVALLLAAVSPAPARSLAIAG